MIFNYLYFPCVKFGNRTTAQTLVFALKNIINTDRILGGGSYWHDDFMLEFTIYLANRKVVLLLAFVCFCFSLLRAAARRHHE